MEVARAVTLIQEFWRSHALCVKIMCVDYDAPLTCYVTWPHALDIVARDPENVFFFDLQPSFFPALFVRAMHAGTGEDEYALHSDTGFSDATKLAIWRIAAKCYFENGGGHETFLQIAVTCGFPPIDSFDAEVLAFGANIAKRKAKRKAKRTRISRMLA